MNIPDHADLLIRQALVYDGSGSDPAEQDVAVRQGRIVAVGTDLPHTAVHEIDASGLALMPGIIDSHTHFDAQITWDALVRPSPAMGVTTAVIGNCGFTIAPCRPKDRELTMRNLTQVEGMSLEVLQQGIDWGFETFPEYLAMLKRKGCVINVAALGSWVTKPINAPPPKPKFKRWLTSCAMPWRQVPWGLPPAPVLRTTAKAACPCHRAWPATKK
jgi:N-acyl-D-aspartate/D-glutamate deacylase